MRTGGEVSASLLPVLDSWAVLAYLEAEKAGAEVREALGAAEGLGETLPLSVVNWAEVLYAVRRARGEEAMARVVDAVDQLPITLVPVDRETALAAARFKATARVSLADAFCCALAELRGAPVLTGDPEFRSLEGCVEVRWLEREE